MTDSSIRIRSERCSKELKILTLSQKYLFFYLIPQTKSLMGESRGDNLGKLFKLDSSLGSNAFSTLKMLGIVLCCTLQCVLFLFCVLKY